MKSVAIALTLIVIAVSLTLAASFVYLPSINPSPQETSASTASSTSTPSASSVTPHQVDNSSSTSFSNSTPSQPEPTPSTPDQGSTSVSPAPANPPDIQLSVWNGVSPSNESIVVIDSPTNNTVYPTKSVTLTVHAGAPSWSYMINLYLSADWLPKGKVLFYHFNYRSGPFLFTQGISVTTTLVDVPDGNHTITITANTYTSIEGSSSVNFTIGGSG